MLLSLLDIGLVCIMFCFFPSSVETAHILKESAAINAKKEEHSRTGSELRRLQVSETTLVIYIHRAFKHFVSLPFVAFRLRWTQHSSKLPC